MFLPRNRYNILNQPDVPVTDSNGKEYLGPIIKTYKNERFKGSVGYGELERVFTKEELELQIVERPFNDYYGPTDRDYQIGNFVRYIVYDSNLNLYKEVNLENYNRFKNLSQVKNIILTWYIYKPADDTIINGYLFTGSATRNRTTLQQLSKDNPGLLDFLNPYQYIKEN